MGGGGKEILRVCHNAKEEEEYDGIPHLCERRRVRRHTLLVSEKSTTTCVREEYDALPTFLSLCVSMRTCVHMRVCGGGGSVREREGER